ncbi:MAG TPA: hypothetical protein P5513_07705 [Candidatus Diapherotrites archaeon]|jgi:hypothetical protein|nr:hypothetical protein [Candidatus Diapherotrites archaeon]
MLIYKSSEITELITISSSDGHKFIILGLNNPFKRNAILLQLTCSFNKYSVWLDITLVFIHIFIRYNTKIGREMIDAIIDVAEDEYNSNMQ